LKFGVNILNFSEGATPESLLSRARTAESMGFHSALISDHVAVTPSVRHRYPEPFYDTFATLAWLSGQTSRILLGTTVCVVPYRHPVEIARLTANIDHFSSGRLVFGVGVGGAEDEFAVLGVPFHRRGAITDEYLEVIHALWTQDEVTFHGRFVTIDRVSGIRPLAGSERPYPPVWVGGRSEAAMKRAVRFDASWHPNRLTPGWLRDEGMPQLKAVAAATGSPVPALCPRMLVDMHDNPVEELDRQMGVGSLDQVAGDMRLLQELGAEHVLFDWYRSGHLKTARDDERGWRMLSLLAEKVIDLRGERLRS
jgi:probable F420-dependent oxidoreductase